MNKIILVLLIAYFASNFLISNVFLANSPIIRPNLPGYFLTKIDKARLIILAKLNFNFNLLPKTNENERIIQSKTFTKNQTTINNTIVEKETIEFLKKSLKPITKGVYASSIPGYSYNKYVLDEIEWVKITYVLKSGKSITIKYPKGTVPPPKEIFED